MAEDIETGSSVHETGSSDPHKGLSNQETHSSDSDENPTDQQTTVSHQWGRVVDDGTVYVKEGSEERAVGSYPDATPEEALAYFERKYADLAGQVTLLEQRVKHGARAKDVAHAVKRLAENVQGANAVGDLQCLTQRLAALNSTIADLAQKQSAQAQAAVDTAIAERTHIVEEIEKIASQDPNKVQWKKTSQNLEELFARWQRQQTENLRIPQNTSSELWNRFRIARTTIENKRRTFFAERDIAQQHARTRKESLIEQAEVLAPRGAQAVPAYQALLDKWKKTGKAGKRYDDELWQRFTNAGDVLYKEKAEVDARTNEELETNLTKKLALLDEAEPLLTEKDREKARTKLLSLQRRWDGIGKVPREQHKKVEDRLGKIETAVRRLDENHWRTYNPEKKARSEGLASQLHESIAKLESELAEANKTGDKKKIADAENALAARRLWLSAIDDA